jgi:hypothetical protein
MSFIERGKRLVRIGVVVGFWVAVVTVGFLLFGSNDFGMFDPEFHDKCLARHTSTDADLNRAAAAMCEYETSRRGLKN